MPSGVKPQDESARVTSVAHFREQSICVGSRIYESPRRSAGEIIPSGTVIGQDSRQSFQRLIDRILQTLNRGAAMAHGCWAMGFPSPLRFSPPAGAGSKRQAQKRGLGSPTKSSPCSTWRQRKWCHRAISLIELARRPPTSHQGRWCVFLLPAPMHSNPPLQCVRPGWACESLSLDILMVIDLCLH